MRSCRQEPVDLSGVINSLGCAHTKSRILSMHADFGIHHHFLAEQKRTRATEKARLTFFLPKMDLARKEKRMGPSMEAGWEQVSSSDVCKGRRDVGKLSKSTFRLLQVAHALLRKERVEK